jgi:ferrous iron transport protein B
MLFIFIFIHDDQPFRIFKEVYKMQHVKKDPDTDQSSSCHCTGENRSAPTGLKTIALVGTPNVGKSLLFGNLTKNYVIVSNYPGTSVEITRGKVQIGDETYEIVDTPGMYALSVLTEEERVARRILIYEKPEIVIHVLDAKNLKRMLPFTIQLIEAELPLILVLNMMDEARKSGVEIDIPLLAKELGIPVVATVSTTGEGMNELKERIERYGR